MFIHKSASTGIRTFWLTTIRFHCAYAEHRTAILQSSYHKNGLSSTKMAKNIQSILQNNLENIQNVQKQLDKQRENIIKANISLKEEQLVKQQPANKKLLQDYYESYTDLMRSVQKCPLNNDWIYKLIAWYNMVPFYKTLVERMINAKEQEELIELVGCLSQMKYQWNNPYGIIDQSLFKQNNISIFYKRLDTFDLQIPTVRQIESILIVPLNLAKRIFFNRYFNHKIDYFLKYLQVTESYTLNDVIWLMNAYVRAMNDDEHGISFLEKYLISHRPPLSDQDITLLMRAYELKGRINKSIYQLIIKPYILKQKMGTIEDLIDMVRFTVCSESQDNVLLKNIYELITIKHKHSKITSSRHMYYLHLYTHYLRIKGYKIKLPAVLEKDLYRFCQQRAEGRLSANRLMEKIINGKEFDDKIKKAKYKSLCLSTEQSRITEFEQTEKSVFEKQFSHRLKLLSLSDYKIYEKPVFCCFELDYFLVHKHTNECLDIEIQGIQYVFASGRLIRERAIRDEMLAHYNIKINHVDYNYIKSKSKFDEDQLLMNKRIRSNRQ